MRATDLSPVKEPYFVMSQNTPDRLPVTLDPFTSEELPEYQRVAAKFLISYRNEQTRTNYAQALNAWFEWCVNKGLDPLHAITRSHIEFWLRYQEDTLGLAPRTIAGRCNALSGYYKTAVMDGHIEGSPMVWVKRPRIERKSSTNHLTGPELARIIERAAKTRVRDEAMFCLLGYNGLRVGELLSINVENLDRMKGFRTVTFTRKGGTTQTLPLAQRTAWAVERWVGERNEGPLFTSLWDPEKRLSRGDVARLCKRYAKDVGIKKRISPHSFRHSFITLALDAGVHQRDVQRSAGHADARMTAYYDHGSSGMAKDATFGVAAHVEGMI